MTGLVQNYREYRLEGRERQVLFAAGYIILAAIAFLFYRSIILAAAAGLGVKFVVPFYEEYMAGKRVSKLERQFRDLLYSLSASISAGRHMGEALAEAEDNLSAMYESDEPIMKELRHMCICMRENKESDSVLLEDFARRSGSEDINNFVQVYITCRTLGGDMVAVISRTIEILTEKMSIKNEIETLTAQKKYEGRMISAMPVAMLLILNMTSSTYIQPLYHTLAGRIIMTVCLGLCIWAVWLMEKISRIEL